MPAPPPSPALVRKRLTELLPDAVWTDEENLTGLSGWRGAYALVLFLPKVMTFFHRGAPVALGTGWFVYAGSAYGPGGVAARLSRHFHHDKKSHWHVDTLTSIAPPAFAFAIREGNECAIVSRLVKSGAFDFPIGGFGSSDCRSCLSHLLRLR